MTWQVNGNSAMTAFEIVFYQNNTGSSQLYTTGKVTEGCPFYGTNYAGKVIPFSYTIPTASLTGAGMANGNTYKLIITQYWSDQDSVTQVSAAAFVTRAAPTLVIDNMPGDPGGEKRYVHGDLYPGAGRRAELGAMADCGCGPFGQSLLRHGKHLWNGTTASTV